MLRNIVVKFLFVTWNVFCWTLVAMLLLRPDAIRAAVYLDGQGCHSSADAQILDVDVQPNGKIVLRSSLSSISDTKK